MHLLGIDLGLRTGLALYDQEGALLYARCQQVSSKAELKTLARQTLDQHDIKHVFVEGDRSLGDVWQKESATWHAQVHRVAPETWRNHLFFPREWRDKKSAKNNAQKYAQNVIAKLAKTKPTSLRTDAAEAILIGLYGLWVTGILTENTRNFIRQKSLGHKDEAPAFKPWAKIASS